MLWRNGAPDHNVASMSRTLPFRRRGTLPTLFAAIVITAAACGDSNGPAPAFGPGTWDLVSVNGEPLPFEVPGAEGSPGGIIEGASILVWSPDSLRSLTPRLAIVPPGQWLTHGADMPHVAVQLRGGDSLFVVDEGTTEEGEPLAYFLAHATGREIRGEFNWRLSAMSDSLLFIGDWTRVEMVFRRR